MKTRDKDNGNIRHMVTSLTDLSNNALTPQGMAYNYDQLNRLTKAIPHQGITGNQWDGSGTAMQKYKINDIQYDANGNITYLERNGDQGSNLTMDELTYHYKQDNNQLKYVDDNTGPKDIVQGKDIFTSSPSTF